MSASRARSLAIIKSLSTPDPDSRWPQGCDDWRFDMTQPYPFYSPPEPSTIGAPLPNGGFCDSTSPLPPSSERATTPSFYEPNSNFHAVARQQSNFSAEVQPLARRQPLKARTPKREHEVSTSPSRSYIANPRKRAISEEVPEQHETLVSMQDAREEAEVRMGRARTAAKRVASTSSIVQELSDTLIAEKAVKTRGVHQAAALEHAAVKALDALKLARAELSTIQKRLEGYGRPRRLFNYFMVRWGAETRLEAEGAEWRVDEAERVYSSARAEADTAWDTMYRCAQEIGVTSSLLSKAQESHANAKRVHLALQKAAHLATDRALRTAEAVEVERSSAESVYEGCERDGRMHHPLLELSRAAACCEDGLTSDQVVRKTKRVRH